MASQIFDDGADGWEGVALGWGQTNVERGFELIAKLDQVEGIPSEVGEEGKASPPLPPPSGG